MGKVVRVLVGVALAALTVVASPPPVTAAPILHGGPIAGWMATTVPVPANDIAYDAARAQLLVTVQRQHASLGNELVEIDPVNGALGRRVLVGSDPGRVVVTDDGSMAYVALQGASQIVRVDLSTFTVAATIDIPITTTSGPQFVDDIDVLPGRSDAVVATLRSGVGAHVLLAFEDDVALPATVWTNVDHIEAVSPTSVFGVDGGYALEHGVFTVDGSGVVGSTSNVFMPGSTGDIEAALGKVYSTTGLILDPATGEQVGAFDGYGLIEVTGDGQITVVGPSNSTVSVFDATTGAQIGSSQIIWQGIPASTALVATTTGFALAGAQGVTLLGSVVSSAGYAPPTPEPSGIGDLQHLALPYKVNDAVYDEGRDLLYASVASGSPNRANQVIAIDPATGSVVDSLPVAHDPGPLAMDEGATLLHVGRNANGRVDTIDLAGFTVAGSFGLGSGAFGALRAGQIEVRPGTTDELIVALEYANARVEGVGLFVNGARRPSFAGNVSDILLGDGSAIWGTTAGWDGLLDLVVDDDGIEWGTEHRSMGFGAEALFHEGRIYSSSRRVFDPEVPALVGTLPFAGPVLGDRVTPRLYVFEPTGIREVDEVSLRTVGTYSLNDGWPARSAVSMQTDDALRFAVVGDQLVLVSRRLPGTGTFHPIAPARLADSRSGHGLTTRLSAGVPQQLPVTGVGGVPATGVSAVVVNLTAVGSNTSSYVTAWPAGLERPRTSNVNFLAGRVVANQAIVPVGAGGRINVVVDSGVTHLVVDVQGWFGDGTEVPGSRLNTLRPARLADSRIGNGLPAGRLTAGATRSLQVTGRLGVPSTGVSAVVVNLTSVAPTANSYLTAWPTGQPRPRSSNLNFAAGQVVANQAIIPVGAGGRIDLAVAAGATHVVVDVQGWFGPAGSATGSVLHTSSPTRIVDSRVPTGIAGRLPARSAWPVQVGGAGGVPPSGATAVVANLTVVQPTTAGHLVAWPMGLVMPLASNVNFSANQVVANQAIVPTGTWGRISVYSNHADTHLVIDVQGWFASA